MCKNSTLPHLHCMYSFFPSVFVSVYQKHDFLQICTACKSITTQKYIFDVICHVIFHIFGRAETLHYNHECSY